MSSDLTVIAPAEIATKMSDLAAKAREIVAEGVPANTRRTYRSQWINFTAWCLQHHRQALPTTAETLILFLTDRSLEVKVASLEVALAAITVAHREAGLTDWAATDLPGVRAFMRGLRRKKAQAPAKKEAFRLTDLAKGLPQGDDLNLVQERAILLLGFFSAMRRSELVNLNVDDVKLIPSGLRILVRTSKTDKESQGQVVSVPDLPDQPHLCPVRAVRAWAMARPKTEGEEKPLFISSRSGLRMRDENVAHIVKRAAERAGFSPDVFGAHSLRSGFATSAAEAEAEERDIMRVTRHRSEKTVREYIHEAEMGQHHPGRAIAEKLKS